MMKEDSRLHLTFIQQEIVRKNSHSFAIKEWTLAITAITLVVFCFGGLESVAIVALMSIPIVLCWLLDTYYLCLRLRFSKLYDAIVEGDDDIPVLSMKVDEYKVCYLEKMFSPSQLMYPALLFVFLLIICVVLCATVIQS